MEIIIHAVLYKLDKELSHPASMNFYPDFHNGKIYKNAS